MITRFKIFENDEYQDEDDLVELFSQQDIEDYFEKNYDVDIEDEAAIVVNLWNLVDEDKVKDFFIKQTIKNTEIDDYSIFNYADYYSYIKEKIFLFYIELNKFRITYNLGTIKYEDILSKMDIEDLINLIINKNESVNFITNYFEEKWDDYTAREIFDEIYMDEYPYRYIKNFLNKQDIKDEFFRTTQYEDKHDYFRDCIPFDMSLQKKLIKIDPNTVKTLFDIIPDNQKFVKTYKFQKLYLDMTSLNKNDREYILADSIKKINDNFGLNKKIEKEYKDYLYLIDVEKYNL